MALLKKSQANNVKVGLTGLLVHKNGQFMQLIEGPEEVVRATLKKIEADTRHKNVTTLLEGKIPPDAKESIALGLAEISP